MTNRRNQVQTAEIRKTFYPSVVRTFTMRFFTGGHTLHIACTRFCCTSHFDI